MTQPLIDTELIQKMKMGNSFKFQKKSNRFLQRVIGFRVSFLFSNSFLEKNGKAVYLLKKKSKPHKERKKPKVFELSMDPEGVFEMPKMRGQKFQKDVKMEERK